MECAELKTFFQAFFKTSQVSTFRLKWLRIKGYQEFTNIHTDYYRFEDLENSEPLHIAWIPLSKALTEESKVFFSGHEEHTGTSRTL